MTIINTKKHGAGSENRLGPFSLHDASRSNLIVHTEIGHVHFLILLVVDWQQGWRVVHVVHTSLDNHEQHDLVFHNKNKDYLYVGVTSFAP